LSSQMVHVPFCPYKDLVVVSSRILLFFQTVHVLFCLYKDIVKAELDQLSR
jgi:hypothetical protein